VSEGGWRNKHGVTLSTTRLSFRHSPVPQPDLMDRELAPMKGTSVRSGRFEASVTNVPKHYRGPSGPQPSLRPTPHLALTISIAFTLASSLGSCSSRIRESSLSISTDGVVSTSINGFPVDLVVDTGSTHTILLRDASQDLAARAIPWPNGTASFRDSQGQSKNIVQCIVDVECVIGSTRVSIPRLPLLEANKNNISSTITLVPKIDGLLGMDVLGELVLWFDQLHHRISVLDPLNLMDTLNYHDRRVLAILPLNRSQRGPRVKIQVDGSVDFDLLFDTGSAHTSLPIGAAAQLMLQAGTHLLKPQTFDVTSSVGNIVGSYTIPAWNGSSQGWLGEMSEPRPIFHLRKLYLGSVEVRDVPIVETDRIPTLGRDVLSRFEWIWHGPQGKVLLLGSNGDRR
jgi:hypothetical protein